MATTIDFPLATAVGQEFTAAGIVYTWNGQGWLSYGAAGNSGGAPLDAYTKAETDARYVSSVGDVMTGTLSINIDATAADHLSLTDTAAGGGSFHLGPHGASFWIRGSGGAAMTIDGPTKAVAMLGTLSVEGLLSAKGISNVGTLTNGGPINASGDLTLNRGGSNAGAVLLGTSGTKFFSYDGTNLIAAGAPLLTFGLTNSGAFLNGGAATINGDLTASTGSFWGLTNSNALINHGDLTVNGNAYKTGGGNWGATSDIRVKNVIGDYESGLDAIVALRPVRYTFKGNDTRHPAVDAVPYKNSAHHDAAVAAREFIGLLAQEAEGPMPEMVTSGPGYIDGAEVTDLRELDTSPLVFALINAVKELSAANATLAARVAALEGAA